MMTTWLLAALLATSPSVSSSTAPAPLALDLAEVLARVDAHEPLLKLQAIERLKTTIALRRARWNRVSGGLGLGAAETVNKTAILFAGRPPATGTLFDRFSANLDAEVNFPLFAGGAITYGIDAALARDDQQRYVSIQARRALRHAALLAYGQLVAATHQLEVATRALARADVLVQVAERRRVAGIGTDAEVARAKLSRLRQQEEVELRSGDRAFTQATLNAALLLPNDTALAPTQGLSDLSLHGAASQAARRPELFALESAAAAAEFERKVAFAGYLPRLELFTRFTYGNGETFFLGGQALDLGSGTQRFGVFSGTLAAGVRLTWTAFDFFITRDRVAQAAADRDAAEARLADEVRGVERDRAQAEARETQAQRRIGALAGGTEQAALTVKLARARYESGNATLTEVLDAELEAIGIEARQIQAAFDHAAAHLDRLRAEGQEL